MRRLTGLLLLASSLSACMQPPVTPGEPPEPPPEFRPTSATVEVREARVTAVLESQLTRTPTLTPPPGQQFTPQVSALPPVQPEMTVELLTVEYLADKTLVRVRMLPPAALFAAETNVSAAEAYLEDGRGNLYQLVDFASLTPDLIELEFPPLEIEQGELRLHLRPQIMHVPADQKLQVDLRDKPVGEFWTTSQTLTFGASRLIVNQMRLVVTGTPSGDQVMRMLSLEIRAEGGQTGDMHVVCLELQLPAGVLQGSGSCQLNVRGLLESSVELGIQPGENHPLLTAPFEMGVSAIVDAAEYTILTWTR